MLACIVLEYLPRDRLMFINELPNHVIISFGLNSE